MDLNSTVSEFYSKNAAEGYRDAYDRDHGPRLDAVVERWNLRENLRGKRVLDVGGGLGFLGKRLGPEVDYWVIDGAKIPKSDRLCAGRWTHLDLDHDGLNSPYSTEVDGALPHPGSFDAAFCLETLEHVGNPHHALVEIKKLVKPRGDIYLSVPPISVWHNTPYCGLMWPRQNWEQFLWQMALGPFEYWPYVPKDRGWPAECYKCVNAPWAEKRLLFPKTEAKFIDCTPLEATNL